MGGQRGTERQKNIIVVHQLENQQVPDREKNKGWVEHRNVMDVRVFATVEITEWGGWGGGILHFLCRSVRWESGPPLNPWGLYFASNAAETSLESGVIVCSAALICEIEGQSTWIYSYSWRLGASGAILCLCKTYWCIQSITTRTFLHPHIHLHMHAPCNRLVFHPQPVLSSWQTVTTWYLHVHCNYSSRYLHSHFISLSDCQKCPQKQTWRVLSACIYQCFIIIFIVISQMQLFPHAPFRRRMYHITDVQRALYLQLTCDSPFGANKEGYCHSHVKAGWEMQK